MLAVSGLVLAVGVGCSPAGNTTAATGQPASPENEIPAASEEVAAQRTISPLEEYLSLVWGTNVSEEERARQANELSTRQEELVAQCMQEAGFEYHPNPPADIVTTPANIWRPDDREWVAQYGYGLVHSPTAELGEAQPVYDDDEDPNQEFVASLSDAERDAYFETLYGPAIADEDHVWTWEDGGCWGFAQHETAAESPSDLLFADEFAPIFEAINQMQTDPWLADQQALVNRDWAACMAEKGYPGLTVRTDAEDQFRAEADEFFAAWWDDGRDPAGSPELAEFGQREVDLALADLDCREAVDYQGRMAAAQFELEGQFVNEHRAELESLRSAAEQMR